MVIDVTPGSLLWERQPGEGARAWEAFCAYRDLGPRRSIDKAWRALNPRHERATAPRHWREWARTLDWVDRAEAWDARVELIARGERQAEHMAELEAFRERQKKLAVSTLEATLHLLERLVRRLEALEPDDIPVASLPAFMRACVAVARSATDAEADAIAVTELLHLLDAEESRRA